MTGFSYLQNMSGDYDLEYLGGNYCLAVYKAWSTPALIIMVCTGNSSWLLMCACVYITGVVESWRER